MPEYWAKFIPVAISEWNIFSFFSSQNISFYALGHFRFHSSPPPFFLPRKSECLCDTRPGTRGNWPLLNGCPLPGFPKHGYHFCEITIEKRKRMLSSPRQEARILAITSKKEVTTENTSYGLTRQYCSSSFLFFPGRGFSRPVLTNNLFSQPIPWINPYLPVNTIID